MTSGRSRPDSLSWPRRTCRHCGVCGVPMTRPRHGTPTAALPSGTGGLYGEIKDLIQDGELRIQGICGLAKPLVYSKHSMLAPGRGSSSRRYLPYTPHSRAFLPRTTPILTPHPKPQQSVRSKDCVISLHISSPTRDLRSDTPEPFIGREGKRCIVCREGIDQSAN